MNPEDLLKSDLRRDHARKIISELLKLDQPPAGLAGIVDTLMADVEPAKKSLAYLLSAKFWPGEEIWQSFWPLCSKGDRDLQWFLTFQMTDLLQSQRQFWLTVDRFMDDAEPSSIMLFLYALRRWRKLPGFVVDRLPRLLHHSSVEVRRAALTILADSSRLAQRKTLRSEIKARLTDTNPGIAKIAGYLLRQVDG